jgi:hypothetical protein
VYATLRPLQKRDDDAQREPKPRAVGGGVIWLGIAPLMATEPGAQKLDGSVRMQTTAMAPGPWGTEVGFERIKASDEILARRVGR